MQRNEEAPKAYPGEYSTDLVAARSLEFLDEAIPAGKPFFIGVAPIGPHAQTINGRFDPAVPADRHKDLLPGLKVPRTANFNPDVVCHYVPLPPFLPSQIQILSTRYVLNKLIRFTSQASSASWIKTLEKFNETVVDYIDEFYRTRILSLLAVDELVDSIVRRLEEAGPEVLENTYIIYTTDNGYHVGQHRLAPGKTCPIEEDVNIPFIVRGPGVAKGEEVSFPTSHTDIVPTIFELAGIPLQEGFDGEPIPVTAAQRDAAEQEKTPRTEHVNIEYWGDSILEGGYPSVGSGVNGSKFTHSSTNSYSYSYASYHLPTILPPPLSIICCLLC